MSSNSRTSTPFQEDFTLAEIMRNNKDTYSDDAVKFTDLENFFSIYQDENAYYRYNLNSTVYLNVPSSRLKTYVCKHDMHWPTISYDLYGTVRLAWVLMKVNGITPDISFDIVPAGSSVKYLDRSDITTVIDSFNR